MSIEAMDKKAEYVYRLNPYANCCVDRKRNVHGARWQHYRHFDLPSEALAAVVKLAKGEGEEPK